MKFIKIPLIAFFFIACGFITAGCSSINTQPFPTTAETSAPSPTPTPGMSAEVAEYLDEVFDLLQTHHYDRDSIDWEKLKSEVYARKIGAQSAADTYDSIKYVLLRIKDHHGFFLTPQDVAEFNAITLEDVPAPESMLVDGRYGYLKLYGFASGDLQVNQDYADNLHAMLMELDAQSPCGYILDLRENYGGNLLPMYAGVGPLFGEGLISSWVGPQGELDSIYYQDGRVWDEWDIDLVYQITVPDVRLQVENPPIAILIGRGTISAGEMLALAFEGVPNTIYFGHATGGLLTGNDMFELSDGALFFFTTDIFMDRTGQLYDGNLEPDRPLIAGFSQDVPEEAIEWLQEQPACRDK
ncbi:MAG: S41 family peptidase [Anaerolineales bacterium]|jgi:C-terminal processing protease CtpA/Prc